MNVQLSRRRFLKIAAITTGSLALAACAPAPTPAPAQKPAATTAPAAAPAATQPPAPTVAPAPKGTTTLRMAWWGGDPRHKKYNDILDMYEKLKPGIKIEREFAAYDAYWQKLATQVAGGNPPDLITNHQDLVNEYANRGALLALDALIEAKKIDLTDWPKGTVDSGKRNGKNWMLALGGTCASTMFNETWLKALGITIPAKPIKWTEYADWATQIQAKLPANNYATTDNGGSNVSYEPYFVQLGMPLYKGEKLGELGYTKEALADWWNLWEKLRGAKALPPAAMTVEQGSAQHADSLLVKKIAPLHLMNANQLQIYQSFMKEDTLGILPIPRGPEGKPSGDWLGTAWQSISSKTKFVDECTAFTNWFINDIEPQKIFAAEHGLPGNKKIAAQIVPTLNAPTQKGINMVASVADTFVAAPDRPSQSAEVMKAFSRFYQEVMFGRLQVKQAVDQYFDEAKRILTT